MSDLVLWVLILTFSFSLCGLGGGITLWLSGDMLLAKIIGTTLGVIGIFVAFKVDKHIEWMVNK